MEVDELTSKLNMNEREINRLREDKNILLKKLITVKEPLRELTYNAEMVHTYLSTLFIRCCVITFCVL